MAVYQFTDTQAVNAAILNTNVMAPIAALQAGQYDTGWQALSLSSGYTGSGTNPSVRMIGPTVYFKGTISPNSGNFSGGFTNLFTLPSATFAPVTEIRFVAATTSSGTAGSLVLDIAAGSTQGSFALNGGTAIGTAYLGALTYLTS